MKKLVLITTLTAIASLVSCSRPKPEQKATINNTPVPAQIQTSSECGFIERDVSYSFSQINCEVEGKKANGTVRRKGFDYVFISDAVVKKEGDKIIYSYYAPPVSARQTIIETIDLKTGDRVQNVIQSGKQFTFTSKDLPKYEQSNDGSALLKIDILETDGKLIGEDGYKVSFVNGTQTAATLIATPSGNGWKKLGSDSNGEDVWLNVESIQNKPHAGDVRFFKYQIGDRVNTAYTKDCAGGDGQLSWYVEDKQILATSQTGIDLVEAVCK
jgi:hypothetical protein